MPDNKFKVGDHVRILSGNEGSGLDIGEVSEVFEIDGDLMAVLAPLGWDNGDGRTGWWFNGDEIEKYGPSTDSLPPQFAVTYKDAEYYDTSVNFFSTIEDAEGYALSLNTNMYRDITILQRIAKVETKSTLVR